MEVAVRIDEAHAHDLLEGLVAHRARIHPQCAADVAGDALEPLEAADPRIARGVGQLLLLHADARVQLALAHFEPLELAARKMRDHAADAAVAHEQIRAASHDEKRDAPAGRELHQPRETILRLGLDPELRGAADAHRGVLGERLVEFRKARPHHVLDLVQRGHVLGQQRCGLVDVARAEADDAVARFEHAPHLEHELPAVGLVVRGLVAFAQHFIDDRLPGHAGDRRLARGIHVGDDRRVGVGECAAEFLLELLRAREAVRLEHAEHALAPGVLRRGERRADLARVVAVVVHDHVAVAAILDLKAPARAAEGLQRLGDLCEGDAEFRGECDDTDGVAHVVAARHVQRHRAERLAAAQHAEVGLEVLRMHVVEAVEGGARFAIRDRPGMRRADARGVRIVRAEEDVAARLAQELVEDDLDRREVGVIIQMLLLDVQHDRVLGMVEGERAIALVALGHEELALRVPVRVRAEDRDLRADVVRGIHAAHAQDVRGHRGGRRLPVHAADDDALLAVQHRRQRVGAAHHVAARADRLVVFGIPRPDGGGVDDEIGVRDVRRVVVLVKVEAERLEPRDLDVHRLVRAAHLVAEREQEPGDAAHA